MILTKEEKAWVKKLNKHLETCPSDRMRFFATGDRSVYIGNNDTSDEWDLNDTDTLQEAQRHCRGADETIEFPNHVEGVCG